MTEPAVLERAPSTRWSLVQFTLLASYTAGFHGVTSLPYYIHKHSGLFLVAYYVLVVLICIPVCYVQIKLGALFKRGIVGMFGLLVPILKGPKLLHNYGRVLGPGAAVSILILTYIRCILHGLELSYALYFCFASMQSPFPWSMPSNINATEKLLKLHHSSADKYFHEDFLQRSEHIAEGGYVLWYIALCLLATWLAIYFLTFKGTAMIGKVAYVLTPVTLLTLLVVLIYGYTAVPGGHQAVSRLLGSTGVKGKSEDPLDDVLQSKLSSPLAWIDALNLHIYSLGLWSGLLPTLGTMVYNRKYVVNASWILLLLVYSILPQVALFALAPYIDPHDSGGFIAVTKGIKPGLPFLFVAIPSAFEKHDLSPVVSFILFLTIVLFGLQHQAVHLLAILENLLPSTPKFLMTYFRRREFLVAAACGASFLLSMPYAIQTKCADKGTVLDVKNSRPLSEVTSTLAYQKAMGGIHLYAIVNDYVDRLLFALIIISTVPLLVGYIKQEVLYIPIERAFMSLWYGLAALISTVLLIYNFAVYIYPVPVVGYDQRWAEDLGWGLAIAPVSLGLLVGAVHALWNQKGPLKQRLLESVRSGTCPNAEASNTSGGTGDTSLQQTTPKSIHEHREPVYDKTETEVFVQPLEDAELTNV